MPKPGRSLPTPSEEIAHFTDREGQQALFRHYLFSATEPPVLMFYGVGGAGKSWLLKKLRGEVPAEIPQAFLNFDRTEGGRKFVFDPPAALYQIRQQLGKSVPRFDLAYGVLRVKQDASEETGVLAELAGELLGTVIPGGATVLKKLSARLKGTALEELLARTEGQKFLLELRAKTAQEIGAELLYYLADDLRKSLATHLNRAVAAVLFFDTFEAISSEAQNEEHKRQYEEWVRDVAGNFGFALTVIAGQNQLTWGEIDPQWRDSLDQQLVGGLSESDARRFLDDCGIDARALQDVILATAREEDGGHHCFSLGLCVDIVDAERGRGIETSGESLRFAPQDWERLARRFLKSLGSDAEGRWIEKLALTPRFDEEAACSAFSDGHSAAQDAAWERLPRYSFVDRLAGSGGWFALREQMRWALESQPSARERVSQDHAWWERHWSAHAASPVDRKASLAWYHQYCTSPEAALDAWNRLVEAARTSVPPRMREHFDLLEWWEPVDLVHRQELSHVDARSLLSLGFEFWRASLGSRSLNLGRAIACFEAALRVSTEQEFPQDWAATQNNLGIAWRNMPIGDGGENLRRAIAFYEAALRVYTEQEFPQDWAATQNNLGIAWGDVLTGDPGENLRRAIECYEAALRVSTEQEFPQDWAATQNNLGIAWRNMPIGDGGENLRRAIAFYEAALRVYTEQEFPQDWAMTQNNLGNAWGDVLTGDPGENLRRAIACYEAALRVYTEQEFPQEWAATQNNLGASWGTMLTGDRGENLGRAIACYKAALRVRTEQEFPRDWATTQNNLGNAWGDVLTGDPGENLRRAIECYEAALRVLTEQEFPREWARTQNNLGVAWHNMPTGDRGENLRRAIACYKAALRVRTEQEFPRDWATTQNNLRLAREALGKLGGPEDGPV